jgi:hypothetical protein
MKLTQEDLLRAIGESTREAIYKSTAPLAAELKAQRHRNQVLRMEVAEMKRATGATPAASKCAAPVTWRFEIERDGQGNMTALVAIPQV